MRACVSLVALSLAFAGCSGHHAASNRGSLAFLRHLTADQANFGVILNTETGQAVAAFRVNNPVRAAIPDGKGGWYIGGGFIHVNGILRKRLAHVDANGRLDPDWKPEANGNGVSVTSLARNGSRLYVGGDFAKLQHEPRFGLGALDIRSGRLEAWRPRFRTTYGYDALIATGRRLIAGGTACCSEAGSSVVALRGSNGARDPSWRPHVGKTKLYGDGVYMLPSGVHAVLIRGLLIRPPATIAAGELDEKTAQLARRWTPRATRRQCLWCQLMGAAVGKNRVFATVNGSSRYSVVSFSRLTGGVDRRWHARISAVTGFYGGTSANAIVVAGGRVYLTGDFDRINGARRNGFAALDQGTGRVLPSWQPHAARVYGSLLAVSGDRLLLAIGLGRELSFDFAGLKTYRPVRKLRLMLALSGPGRVRIGVGRLCNYERWTETARCGGSVFRWLAEVRFGAPERKRFVHELGLAPGTYFLRFVPRARGSRPQPPYDFPIRVPPRKVRSTFRG